MLKSSWKQKKLGDVMTFQRGFDITKAAQKDGPYPVISSSGINSFHSEFKVSGPGVITGRKGTLGTAFFSDGPFWPHDTTLWVKNFHGNDEKFCYYLIKGMDFKQYDVGAANPTLNRNHIHELFVTIPDVMSQQKISSLLTHYDDLIENNQRRIRILEDMAQSLYREWFVHFRFPGHEKVKMIESPLSQIPQGWSVASLGDYLSEIQSGKRPKGGIDADERGVPSIGAENINGLGNYKYDKDKFVSEEFFESMNKGIVKDQDVMLYKDGAYIGRTSYFRDGFPHSKCSINEHVFILRTDSPLTQNWLYFMISYPEMRSQIIGTNANAAQPGINQQSVRGLSFILPPEKLIQKFSDITEPILALLFNLAKRNRNLSLTRDMLLPKLISGETDLSTAASKIKEAA